MCELYMMQANKKGLHSEYEQTKLNRADDSIITNSADPSSSSEANVSSELSSPLMRDSLLIPETG